MNKSSRQLCEVVLRSQLAACGRDFEFETDRNLAKLQIGGAVFFFTWKELISTLAGPIVIWLVDRSDGRMTPPPIPIACGLDLGFAAMTIGAWNHALRDEKRERRVEAETQADFAETYHRAFDPTYRNARSRACASVAS